MVLVVMFLFTDKRSSMAQIIISQVLVLLIFLFTLLHHSNCAGWLNATQRVGVNYGKMGNNLLSPFRSIDIIKSMKAGMVRLYDYDPETLLLLADTGIWVAITIPNDEIPLIAANQAAAHRWVRDNVLAHRPHTLIRFIMVGNQLLSNHSNNNQAASVSVVPAIRSIRNSLRTAGVYNVKVGTPIALSDVLHLNISEPPSNTVFRREHLPMILPLLQFLNSTRSYFFIDAYPYFTWSADPTATNLDYALFQTADGGNFTYTDSETGLVYTNLLDQLIDSLVVAMRKLGFPDIRVAISSTGWPNDGDIDQPAANIYNAATYNGNLVRKLTADPPIGTPARPGEPIFAFVSSLYDENLRDGPRTERHWGMVRGNGERVYAVDLSGQESGYDGEVLPEPTNNKPYEDEIWCVVADDAAEGNVSGIAVALTEVCGRLNGWCEYALAPGRECYEPVSVVYHASYAFSAYWAMFRDTGASCYFGGLATQTTRDPSHGSCVFPSVILYEGGG